MGPGATFAFVTFTSGILLLLSWFYATADRSQSGAMFRRSLWLFALPSALLTASPFQFSGFMWALIAGEEALKAYASTREQNRFDKFWLVALFGIWEMIINKPFYGLFVGGSWDRLEMARFLYATALPVLMHLVTAAIYAFTFERRLWAAFISSWIVHAAFNAAAPYFSTSPIGVIAESMILGMILTVILRRQRGLAAMDR